MKKKYQTSNGHDDDGGSTAQPHHHTTTTTRKAHVACRVTDSKGLALMWLSGTHMNTSAQRASQIGRGKQDTHDQQGRPLFWGLGVEVILGCLNLFIERWTGIVADKAGRYRPTRRTIFLSAPPARSGPTDLARFQPAFPRHTLPQMFVERLVARFQSSLQDKKPPTAVILVLEGSTSSPWDGSLSHCTQGGSAGPV